MMYSSAYIHIVNPAQVIKYTVMHTVHNRALQQNGLKDLTIILISIFVDELTLRML